MKLSAPPIQPVDTDMPAEFKAELCAVGDWAAANRKEARNDRILFWLLKGPAILVSTSAGALAHFNHDDWATFAACIASACVLVDGLRPRGLLFEVHSRAHRDLSKLYANMLSDWRKGLLDGRPPRPLASQIIEKVAPARDRISTYIEQAESMSQHSVHRITHRAKRS